MKKLLTNEAGEVRGLTKKDFKAMKPIKEVLPELANIIPKRKIIPKFCALSQTSNGRPFMAR